MKFRLSRHSLWHLRSSEPSASVSAGQQTMQLHDLMLVGNSHEGDPFVAVLISMPQLAGSVRISSPE
jgi:hypothetical protein